MKIKLKIIWIIIFINLKISELAKSNSKNFQLEFFEISAFKLSVPGKRDFKTQIGRSCHETRQLV